MKADAWPESCRDTQRRHAEGRERPRAKPSIISHKAALISALKQHRNFITLRQFQAGFSSLVPLFIKHLGRPAIPGQQSTGKFTLLRFMEGGGDNWFCPSRL